MPPGKEDLAWVSNSATLISGQKDAVLVDTFLTLDQDKVLGDWVAASGKNLIAIYVTHGHGDHFFGLGPLLERFPHARALATPEIVEAMERNLSPDVVENFWRRLFPGQIPERLTVAEALSGGSLSWRGTGWSPSMPAIPTSSARPACTFPRSISWGVGMSPIMASTTYLAETDTKSRLEWIATLDRLETLQPKAVIAGHKIPENPDDPRIIGETRQYLRDFNRLDATTSTARELYDAMLDIYPNRANPGSLWGAANKAKELAKAAK